MRKGTLCRLLFTALYFTGLGGGLNWRMADRDISWGRRGRRGRRGEGEGRGREGEEGTELLSITVLSEWIQHSTNRICSYRHTTRLTFATYLIRTLYASVRPVSTKLQGTNYCIMNSIIKVTAASSVGSLEGSYTGYLKV